MKRENQGVSLLLKLNPITLEALRTGELHGSLVFSHKGTVKFLYEKNGFLHVDLNGKKVRYSITDGALCDHLEGYKRANFYHIRILADFPTVSSAILSPFAKYIVSRKLSKMKTNIGGIVADREKDNNIAPAYNAAPFMNKGEKVVTNTDELRNAMGVPKRTTDERIADALESIAESLKVLERCASPIGLNNYQFQIKKMGFWR